MEKITKKRQSVQYMREEKKMKMKILFPKSKQERKTDWIRQKTEEEFVDSILKENCTIGEPAPGFNIHKSVFYTHNYFRKVGPGRDYRALCLVCLRSPEGKIAFLRCTNNNIKGKRMMNFGDVNFIFIYRFALPSHL